MDKNVPKKIQNFTHIPKIKIKFNLTTKITTQYIKKLKLVFSLIYSLLTSLSSQ